MNAVMQKTTTGTVSLVAAKLTNEVLRSMVTVKLAKTFAGIMVTIVALASVGGLAVRSAILRAGQLQTKNSSSSAPTWVGQRVVTSMCAHVMAGNQIADSDGVVRIYTVQELNGERARVVAGDVNGWIEIAQIILFDEAIAFYTKDLITNPHNPRAYSRRGEIWELLHKPENALADFTEAIRIAPDSRDYLNRGAILRDKLDYDKAIADYTATIQLEPNWGPGYMLRGIVWCRMGNFDRAIDDLTEAIKLGTRDAYAYLTRGFAWLSMRDYNKAILDLSEAIKLDPTDEFAYYDRGRGLA